MPRQVSREDQQLTRKPIAPRSTFDSFSKLPGSLPASYPQSVMKIILSKTPRIEFHFVLKVSSEAFPIKPSDDSPRISSFDGKATLRGSAT